LSRAASNPSLVERVVEFAKALASFANAEPLGIRRPPLRRARQASASITKVGVSIFTSTSA
jgi:hypothetical protein